MPGNLYLTCNGNPEYRELVLRPSLPHSKNFIQYSLIFLIVLPCFHPVLVWLYLLTHLLNPPMQVYICLYLITQLVLCIQITFNLTCKCINFCVCFKYTHMGNIDLLKVWVAFFTYNITAHCKLDWPVFVGFQLCEATKNTRQLLRLIRVVSLRLSEHATRYEWYHEYLSEMRTFRSHMSS